MSKNNQAINKHRPIRLAWRFRAHDIFSKSSTSDHTTRLAVVKIHTLIVSTHSHGHINRSPRGCPARVERNISGSYSLAVDQNSLAFVVSGSDRWPVGAVENSHALTLLDYKLVLSIQLPTGQLCHPRDVVFAVCPVALLFQLLRPVVGWSLLGGNMLGAKSADQKFVYMFHSKLTLKA